MKTRNPHQETKRPRIIKELVGFWMRWRGWKCEGPAPWKRAAGILILGPGLELGRMETDLLEQSLGFNGRWWHDSMPASGGSGSTPPAHQQPDPRDGLVLVSFDSPDLATVLRKGGESACNIQLVSIAPVYRRIRFNTPFISGRFPERDLAYISRVFSYYA